MRASQILLTVATILVLAPTFAFANTDAKDKEICPRPAAGSAVAEPQDLRSQNGVLKVELRYRSFRDAQGQMRLLLPGCRRQYRSRHLRVHPGDWLILTLQNDLSRRPETWEAPGAGRQAMAMAMMPVPMQMPMPVFPTR